MDNMIKVLAVDGSSDVLYTFELVLTPAMGYELTTTRDRNKALEILKRQEIDIIIYDIPHGLRSGNVFDPDAIKDLKRLHLEYPNTPIIATSTEVTMKYSLEEFKPLGVERCLLKTININELYEIINEVLGSKK